MKIHKAQRDAFGARALETFPRRVQALLAEQIPEEREEIESDQGLARVEALITEARGRGFTSENDACKYVVLSHVIGDGFAGEPWAAAVLADPALEAPSDRMDALWLSAKQRELDEAVADMTRSLR